jgi:flagellar protein FliS
MKPYKVVYSDNWNFSDTKDCPFCGEKIKKIAIKCKHCLSLLEIKDKASPIDQVKSGQETSSTNTKFIQRPDKGKGGTSLASANNVQLIQMLFDGLLESLSAARSHIQHKNFNEKSKAIGRSSRIMIGLQGALDFEKGGELAENLNELYNYVIRRMDHFNTHNDLTVLDEIYGLMYDICDAWKRVPALGQSENINEINPQHKLDQGFDSNPPSELQVIMNAINSTDSQMAAAAPAGGT